jgi:hypothetical protein
MVSTEFGCGECMGFFFGGSRGIDAPETNVQYDRALAAGFSSL